MGDAREDVERVAEAISDGTPIDWDGKYPAGPDRLLDQFRMIEAVAAAHRSWAGRGPLQAGASEPGRDDAAQQADHGQNRIGHYEVEGILGRGGMGVVYLARDTRLDRPVAIKALPDELAIDADRIERFEREAKLLASMNHPHIATVYGMEVDERGRRYLVMERVEGVPLSARLKRNPPVLEEAIKICAAVARALEAAHERGVVHRDLKPGNVMVGEEVVKILDFGLAKRVEDAPSSELARTATISFITDTMVRLGTPGYMSPEQVVGAPQDARADTFAFGCVLYECLTGLRAFTGATAADLLSAALVNEPNWQVLPPGTPQGIRVLLKRCLEKDVDRRSSMAQVRRELDNVIERLAARRIVPSAERPVVAAEVQHNLPQEATSFVGREREIRECMEALGEARLVTLAGIGGCGKSRLALRVARELLEEVPGGVCFVDLSPLLDAERVAATVAAALDLRGEPATSWVESVVAALRERHVLIVLDNCEQVLAGCVELAAALLQRTVVRIIATSREPLSVSGERVYPVPSLSVPQRNDSRSLSDLARYEAVQLFVERARLVDPGLLFDERTARPIADVCERLDGIPLALELAAARMRVLSIQEIGVRLEERFRLLSGTGTKPARHQKLQTVITWSYEHLSPEEQRLLRSLSIFSGATTLGGAAAACGCADEFETLELLTHLVEKSMTLVERSLAGESRYRLLETVREFAWARLEESNEASVVRDRHLDFHMRVVDTVFEKLAGEDEAVWAGKLEQDYANVLAALSWCDRASGGAVKALRMTARLGRFWYIRGELRLGGRELARALTRSGADRAMPERAGALYAAGDLAVFRGEADVAQAYFEQALSIYRGLPDELGILRSLVGLGNVAAERDDHSAARSYYEEVLPLARKLRFRRGEALTLGNLGEIACRQGRLEEAITLSENALAILEEGADRHGLAMTLNNLASYLLRAGRTSLARDRLIEGLRLFRDLGAKRGGIYGLQSAAELALNVGEVARAVRYLGAAAMLRETIGMVPSPREEAEVQSYLARADRELDRERVAAEWTAGRACSFEQIVESAVNWLAGDEFGATSSRTETTLP